MIGISFTCFLDGLARRERPWNLLMAGMPFWAELYNLDRNRKVYFFLVFFICLFRLCQGVVTYGGVY